MPHFRAEALKAAGGWDAFNVTEDADLGIRLARLGYKCAWLDSLTLEEAAWRPRDWLAQRTRWLRGWMQTYFVHMARPGALLADLGPGRFLALQAMVGGITLSVLAYPVFLVQLAATVATGSLFQAPGSGLPDGLLLVNGVNLLLGYGVVLELSLIGLYRSGRRRLLRHLALIPVYWLLVSLAGYLAVWTFMTHPFEWEKTRHGLRRRSA